MLTVAPEHIYFVFKVNVEVAEPTETENAQAGARTMALLMSSNKPRFQVRRYSGEPGHFTIKAIFNRLIDKWDQMGCLFRYDNLTLSHTESSRNIRYRLTRRAPLS